MQYLSLPPGPTRFLFPSPQSLYNLKGSLSNDDGDVYENVVCAASNFIALIPSRLLSQMLVNFFGVGIPKDSIKVQEKKTKLVVLCSLLRQNVKLGTFTS